MLFNSIDFLIFFPIVVGLYFILPGRVKQFWLLAASYYFYMCWNARYAVLILTSTIITYLCGLILDRLKRSSNKTGYQKLAVACSVLLNLGILCYFKYLNFILIWLGHIFGFLHIELNVPQFDILLPVGISFYTFQALGYTIDVYRGDIYAEKNFFRYALFVSFFPQLVAGPIERSRNLLKQLAGWHKFDLERAVDGFFLMLWGYFLKVVLADRIAIFVDNVYGNYGYYTGWYIIVATVLFGIQIYCDFYGYSVIAMGASRILGIQLMENFDTPYLSGSVAEFWRRWHISLTSWFRDYLYIPLGGNRKGKIRRYFNLLIVFLVSGLWHGAGLSFVFWGGLNGIYQIIGELFKPLRDKAVAFLKLNRESLGHRMLQTAGTFLLVDFAWLFFRASGLGEAFAMIRGIFTAENIWILFDGYSIYIGELDRKNFWLMIVCIFILLFADLCKKRGIRIREVILRQDYWFRWLFVSCAVCFILTFGIWGPKYNEANFIYFQF